MLRVEATLASLVRAWSADPAPEDLIRLTPDGGATDVAVHLAVRGEQARLVAHRARAVVRRILDEHGLVPGSVEVSVLTIELSADAPGVG